LSSLKREVRFTVFEVVSPNQTIATIEEATFKQFHDKQCMFVHAIIHQSISQMEASKYISLLKLKNIKSIIMFKSLFCLCYV